MEAGLTGIDIPDFGDPTNFMRGMGITKLNGPQKIRRSLYSLYLALVMAVETKYRGHADTEVPDFAKTNLSTMMATLTQTR